MSIPTVILIAMGLSMDAFAVAVTSGFTVTRLKVGHAMRIALFFGVFQAVMPIVGWLAGSGLKEVVKGVDHWIAFALLSAIGAKMIYESRKLNKAGDKADCLKLVVLLTLAVATSIDALAVGLSLSFLKVEILAPSAIIGAVTFLMSFAGVYIGKKFGHFFESKLEVAGGLILIGIGLKILIEHMGGAA